MTAAFLFFAIAWGMTGWRAAAFSARALAPDLDNAEVRVVGYVASLPQLTPNGWRFEFRVEQAWRDGQPVNVPSRVGLSWWTDPALPGAVVTPVARNMPVRLQAGERWELSVRLRRPHGPLNPHGFDRELWWWQQGVSATGTVRARAGSEARLLQAPMPLRYSVDRARQRVADAIRAQVDDPRSAGVLVALVTGDQSAIDRADWNVFRDTGVAHLMAISGLHVTMFAWLAAACVGALWRASARGSSVLVWRWPATQAAAVGGLLLATAYAVFSGWGIPSQRTVLMLLVVTVLRWRHADWPWPLTWGWVMAAVLLLDPWALLQAGFWLSFVAVGVLMAAGRPAGARPGLLQGLLREQALMTLALAPLTLLLFGQVSLVGLLANLPAIPWVTLGVTPLAMLGVLWPPAWTVGSWAMQGLVIGLEWLARWPWAVWHQAAAPWVWAVLGVLGGVLLVLRLPWPTRMLGVAMMWPALTHTPARPVPGTFDLLALDVGQGGAVLVRTASHSLLYDTGPAFWGGGDAGQQIVVPVLRRLGERLDLVMVSHSDVDHAGGTDAVLAAHPRAAYVASQAPQARSIADSRHGLSGLGRLCREGQHWQWDGVRFDILHPRPADVGGSSNAAS